MLSTFADSHVGSISRRRFLLALAIRSTGTLAFISLLVAPRVVEGAGEGAEEAEGADEGDQEASKTGGDEPAKQEKKPKREKSDGRENGSKREGSQNEQDDDDDE